MTRTNYRGSASLQFPKLPKSPNRVFSTGSSEAFPTSKNVSRWDLKLTGKWEGHQLWKDKHSTVVFSNKHDERRTCSRGYQKALVHKTVNPEWRSNQKLTPTIWSAKHGKRNVKGENQHVLLTGERSQRSTTRCRTSDSRRTPNKFTFENVPKLERRATTCFPSRRLRTRSVSTASRCRSPNGAYSGYCSPINRLVFYPLIENSFV